MDINAEIKELELEKASVMIKTEDKYEGTNNLITTMRDLETEENMCSNLPLSSKEKQYDNYDMYESDINNVELKEEFNNNVDDEKTFSIIKTEEIFLKSDHESICDECDDTKTRAYWEEDRQNHTISNIDEIIASKLYICHNCNYKARRKRNLRRHIQKKHIGMGNLENHMIQLFKMSIKKHSCDHCDYETNNKTHLNRHVLAIHDKSAIKKYVCNHCDYKTHRKDDLNRHVLLKHDKMAIKYNKMAIEKFSCYYCDYMSPRKWNLKKHMIQHSFKRHHCDHCDYRTHDKKYLNKHVLATHYKKSVEK